MRLSIVIPAFNEAKWIVSLLTKVERLQLKHDIQKEIIVIDDGSTDQTGTLVKDFIENNSCANLRFISFPSNQGKGAAVRAGIEEACGDLIIIQDADLEYDPEDINEVILPIVSGDAKVVYGSRILKEKENGHAGILGFITGKHPHSYVLAYLGGVAITKWINFLTGAALTDEPTCYKCFHQTVLSTIRIESNDFAWEPEITTKLLRKGIRIDEVPISYFPRRNAEGKKIGWMDGFKALWAVWKFSQ